MAKDIELIYSQQSSDFCEGRAYANPRFYSTPRQGVSKVFLVGDWPKIEADYTALGVPVERLDKAPLAAPAPAPGFVAKTAADPGSVVIPDDFRSLHWKPLRVLADQLSPVPTTNNPDAIAAIEAELQRRHLDAPHEDAGGLTLRELHADLEALGISWEPTDTPADLQTLRDLARSEKA